MPDNRVDMHSTVMISHIFCLVEEAQKGYVYVALRHDSAEPVTLLLNRCWIILLKGK